MALQDMCEAHEEQQDATDVQEQQAGDPRRAKAGEID